MKTQEFVNCVKFKKIEIRKPLFDPHPEKSTIDNSAWRKGLFIVLEDNDGNEFYYMPKWDELITINEGKKHIDYLNKHIAKEFVYNKESCT